MKKWLISICILILVLFAGAFFFIPRQLNLSSIAYINCAPGAALRVLSDDSKWEKWWPSQNNVSIPGHSFVYKNDTYQVTKKMYNSFEVSIRQETTGIESRMVLLPLSVDTLVVQWQCTLPSGNNPFARIMQYNRALALKKDMNALLGHLKSFLEKQENIYGFAIKRVSEIDTALVATKSVLPVYPGTPEVYRMIGTLKNYIASQQAKDTGYPIMNVTRLADNQYQLMVAVPANRPLKGNATIFPRKMMPIAFVVAEVKGGDYTVARAFEQMNVYFEDYKRIAMAIPFAALITDRTKEPDTAKWVTRIYAPVYPY